jgi:hypothetical protein
MEFGAGRIHLYLRHWVEVNEGINVYLELYAGVWEVHVNHDWTDSPSQ